MTSIDQSSSLCVDHQKSLLEVLYWRIRSLPIPSSLEDVEQLVDQSTLITQLYQLALLLFLDRTFVGLIEQSPKGQELVDKAFALLARLDACKVQFPIHIIGMEARNDEQRATVLDLISRTTRNGSSRSLDHCKKILQAVWARDDLAHDGDTSYRGRVTSVLRHFSMLPCFL